MPTRVPVFFVACMFAGPVSADEPPAKLAHRRRAAAGQHIRCCPGQRARLVVFLPPQVARHVQQI